MDKTVKGIFEKAQLLNDFGLSEALILQEWSGKIGATEEAIAEAEKRLNLKLPDDYVEFLKISNGFSQPSQVGCSFLPVEEIDYLKILDEDLVEIWNDGEDDDDSKELGEAIASSILVGGLLEEQQFLLIPPKTIKGKWGYWKFASWIPGEQKFPTLLSYLKDELSFLKEQTKGLKKPKKKAVIDFSLRDAVFSLDWENVYSIVCKFLIENKTYTYCRNESDLFALLLIAAGKLNRYQDLENLIVEFRQQNKDGLNKTNFLINNDYLLGKYEMACKQKTTVVPDLQKEVFSKKDNPITLEDIERQIVEHRKDLLKEKNRNEKTDYQLHFLFSDGSADDFIALYESNVEQLFFTSHLNAANIFAFIQNIEGMKRALKRYFKIAYSFEPLDPFINQILLPLLDKEFLREVYESNDNTQ